MTDQLSPAHINNREIFPINPDDSRTSEDREARAILKKIEQLNNLYDMDAHRYDWVTTRPIENLIQIAKKEGRPLRVADLCCGTAEGASAITTTVLNSGVPVEATIVDTYPIMLRAASMRLNEDLDQIIDNPNASKDLKIDPLQLDLSTGPLPFEDNSMDVITFYRALHEFPLKRQKELMEEAYRTLTPGGTVVILGNLLNGPQTNRWNLGDFFNKLIQEKDQTAGITSRGDSYFPTRAETLTIMANAGFDSMDTVSQWPREWDTLERLFELGWSVESLNYLNRFADNNFSATEYIKGKGDKPISIRDHFKYRRTYIEDANSARRVLGPSISEEEIGIILNQSGVVEGRSFLVNTGFITATKK